MIKLKSWLISAWKAKVSESDPICTFAITFRSKDQENEESNRSEYTIEDAVAITQENNEQFFVFRNFAWIPL